MKYPLAIEVGDAQHAYGVVIPDIPGCFSAGETLDEAIINAEEAINSHLEILAEAGEAIPQAGTIEAHRNNKEFDGWIWSFVEIDITPYLGKSHKINVTLPELLIKQIDELVATHPAYKSRSGFLAKAAMDEFKHLRSCSGQN